MAIVNLVQRALDACCRFTESRKRCLVFSLIFTSIVFFLATTAWLPGGSGDDYALASALSGHWGGGDGRTLFLNVLLGDFIFFMNHAVPAFNWFVMTELIASWLAFFALTYLSLTRTSLPVSFLIISSVILLMIPGCTWRSNFTFVAAMAACAGGLALLIAVREGEGQRSLIVIGVAFIAFAAMMRFEVFLLCVAFFGLGALIVVPAPDKASTLAQKAAHYAKRALPVWVALCLGFGLFAIDRIAWQEEPWKTWDEYNTARSQIGDYAVKDYEEISDQLTEWGISANDYEMAVTWTFEDVDFFTTEFFSKLAEIAMEDVFAPELASETVVDYFENSLLNSRLMLVLGLALLVSAFCLPRNRKRYVLVFAAMAVVIAVLFAILGRLPERVHYTLWMLAIIVASSWSRWEDRPWSGDFDGEGLIKRISIPAAFTTVVGAVVTVAATYMLVVFVVNHYSVERIEATYSPSTFQVESSVIDYYEAHPDLVFAQSQSAEQTIRKACMMRVIPSHDVLYRSCSLGGWASHSPYRTAQYEEIGMRNVIKGLVDNENARLMMRKSESPDELLTYLREHYYPECTYELVDTIECPEVDTTLRVYDFSA